MSVNVEVKGGQVAEVAVEVLSVLRAKLEGLTSEEQARMVLSQVIAICAISSLYMAHVTEGDSELAQQLLNAARDVAVKVGASVSFGSTMPNMAGPSGGAKA